MSEGQGAFNLSDMALAGQGVTSEMSVLTTTTGTNPLPAGDYTLEIRLSEADKKRGVGKCGVGRGNGPASVLEIPVTDLVRRDRARAACRAYGATVS